MVRRLPAGHNCCVSRNLKMQAAPLVEERGLHWSSFLNNFEAGNSRGWFSRVPLILDNARGVAAVSDEAVAWV